MIEKGVPLAVLREVLQGALYPPRLSVSARASPLYLLSRPPCAAVYHTSNVGSGGMAGINTP